MTRHVHLVGSVGLDSAQDVFATAGNLLGEALLRVPDGEPGGRRMWTMWQYPLFRGLAYFVPDWDAKLNAVGVLPLKFAEGMTAADVHIGELGYAREARASYQDFLAARTSGVLPAKARFQVCLPTPFAVCCTLMRPDLIRDAEGPYEKAMLKEVAAIASAIPHDDLCIQWDICMEMLTFDGRGYMRPYPGIEQVFATSFKRLAGSVPADVELGFHLCYGDLDAKHSLEPADASKMRDLAHLIQASVDRKIAYIHMPVPIGRDDDAFFAPLDDLQLRPGTELFLGLIHAKDGVDGAKRRMAAAAKHVVDFGIASECGISRKRAPELVTEFLKVHAAALKG